VETGQSRGRTRARNDPRPPPRRSDARRVDWRIDQGVHGRLGHALPRAALRYQHAAESRDREIAAGLDDVFAAVGTLRAMESDMREAQINEESVDLGL